MISAFVDAVAEQLSIQFGSTTAATQQIKFDRYVYWLETKLSSISSAELVELDNIADQLSENIFTFKAISAQCRVNMITHNSAQVNRVLKLFDLADSLVEPFGTGRLFISSSFVNGTKYTITSLLPDIDVLRDVIADNKLKLKSIEEIASSKKSEVVKFKTSKLSAMNRNDSKKISELQVIRNEVKNIVSLLEQLTEEVDRRHSVLKYFGQLKQVVHFPLQALSTHLRSLPPLAETSAQLDHDLQALNKVDTFYTMVRRAEILVQTAAVRQEAAVIEDLVRDEILWLRLLSDKEILSSIYEVSKENVGADSNAIWSVHLRKFCQLPLSDLLTLCGAVEGGVAFQSCVRHLHDFLEHLRKDHPLVGRIPPQVRALVAAFDAEMFCAHALDYCERRSIYDNLVNHAEFKRAYEELRTGRTAMDKAQRKYDRTAALFEEYLALHREANLQLAQLKDRCIEIALAEVSEHIEFIV